MPCRKRVSFYGCIFIALVALSSCKGDSIVRVETDFTTGLSHGQVAESQRQTTFRVRVTGDWREDVAHYRAVIYVSDCDTGTDLAIIRVESEQFDEASNTTVLEFHWKVARERLAICIQLRRLRMFTPSETEVFRVDLRPR